MHLRRRLQVVPDYETLTVAIEGSKHSQMPGLLNQQAGHYVLTTLLDGEGNREVVFQPIPPYSQDYASRLNQQYFDSGIVSILSRNDIA